MNTIRGKNIKLRNYPGGKGGRGKGGRGGREGAREGAREGGGREGGITSEKVQPQR